MSIRVENQRIVDEGNRFARALDAAGVEPRAGVVAPLSDPLAGDTLLYTSGTTGRAKGARRAIRDRPRSEAPSAGGDATLAASELSKGAPR